MSAKKGKCLSLVGLAIAMASWKTLDRVQCMEWSAMYKEVTNCLRIDEETAQRIENVLNSDCPTRSRFIRAAIEKALSQEEASKIAVSRFGNCLGLNWLQVSQVRSGNAMQAASATMSKMEGGL